VPPVYPQQARDEKIEGVVVLEVQIDKAGLVSATKAISGHPMLTQAAMDAVKQWAYKPVMLKVEPIDVTSTVTVNFTLSQ
jgi:protein TonB